MRYMTGFSEPAFERLLCVVVPSDREPVFITPALNGAQVKANPAQISDIRAWDDVAGWERTLQQVIGDYSLNAGRVAVDDYMPARFLLSLQSLIPSALVESAADVFVQLRSVKDADELDSMRRAGSLTDAAYHTAAAACKPGVTERELARVITDTIFNAGAELAFEPIVAVAANSALPHHSPGERAVAEGDVVLLDLGARVDGYCGDITRVVSAGRPDAKGSEIYEIVYNAHTRAVEAAKSGVPAAFVDRTARQVIESAGYGERFFHRTGHGIGLDDHESPNIAHGNDTPLAPGNCFSVEPGIYLEGSFGVRLENILALTSDGREVLNEPIPPRLMDAAEVASS